MKILSAHVDGFCNLVNVDYDFTKNNPFEVLEDNGSGKSSLLHFLLCVFYGIDEKVDSNRYHKNERKIYQPWNANAFGGSVVISVGTKTYKIARIFGESAKKDELKIYDATTNLESKDFNPDENLGEQLFKIDRMSFLNTAFIDHGKIMTVKSTDSINAKIGGVSDMSFDLNNLENAKKKCKEYTNKNSLSAAKGSLNILKNIIADENDKVSSKGLLETKLSQLENENKKLVNEKESLQKTMEDNHAKLLELSKRRTLSEKVNHYNYLTKQVKEKKASLESVVDMFGNEIPSKEDLNNLREINRNIASTKTSLENKKKDSFVLDEKILEAKKEEVATHRRKAAEFEESINQSNDEIEKVKGQLEASDKRVDEANEALLKVQVEIKGFETQSGENKLEELNLQRRNKKQALEELNGEISRKNSLKEEARLKALEELEVAKQRLKKAEKTGRLLAGASIFVLIVGIVMLVIKLLPIAIVCFIIGVCGLFLGLNQMGKVKKGLPNFESSTLEDTESDYLIKQSESLKAEIESLTEKITAENSRLEQASGSVEQLNKKLSEATEKKNYYEQESKVLSDKLEGLKKAVGEFRLFRSNELTSAEAIEKQLEETKQNSAKNEAERLNQVEELKARLNQLNTSFLNEVSRFASASLLNDFKSGGNDAEGTIVSLEESLNSYTNFNESFRSSELTLKKFEEENPDLRSVSVNEDTTESDREIEERLKADNASIPGSIKELEDKISKAQRDLEACADKLDEIREIESKLEVDRNTLKEGKAKLEVVKKTAEILDKAGANFIASHMSKVQVAFNKYYEILSGEPNKLFRFNANMELQYTLNSKFVKIEGNLLSDGYMDLVGLCYRFALIDAMYEKEKPCVFLDDTFSNLDDNNLLRVKKFLHDIANEYQIIYMTCTTGRSVL